MTSTYFEDNGHCVMVTDVRGWSEYLQAPTIHYDLRCICGYRSHYATTNRQHAEQSAREHVESYRELTIEELFARLR